MTQNQIAYQNLLETIRSNRERETETARSNRANESQTQFRDAETQRANKASEQQKISELAEATRSHKANEGITSAYNQARIATDRSQLAESIRHNKEVERQTDQKLSEQILEFQDTLNQKGLDRVNSQQVAQIAAEARRYVGEISSNVNRLNAQERLELDSLIRKWDMTLKTLDAVPTQTSKWIKVLQEIKSALLPFAENRRWNYYNQR